MTDRTGFTRGQMMSFGAVLVAAVIGGAIFLFFSGDEPEEVDLGSAVAAVEAESTTTTAAPNETSATTEAEAESTTTTTAAAPADGLDGMWTVDTTIGTFSFEDATSSFVGFRVREDLSGVGEVDAVGRTPAVTGTVEIDGTTIVSASFEADLSQITTDRSRRDNAVKRVLNVSDNPLATFIATAAVDVGSIPAAGESVAFSVAGDLTINGITNQVVFPLEAQVVDDVIVVVGQLDVVFGDYDVEVPSAPVVLSADDHGPIEVQLFFTR